MSPASAHRDPDAELIALLRGRGLRVTSPRLVIHRELRARDHHVTAEEARDAVAAALPGISLPTVYATLELFEELGIVRRVDAGRGAVRYDPRTDVHHHAVCRRCGRVEDFDGDAGLEQALLAAEAGARREGFAADGAAVVLTGLCEDCRATGRERSSRPSPAGRAAGR
jgi:Fur family ferric uptake transcriptional regulator/Fur family peroxide stress response transcriptional regulator